MTGNAIVDWFIASALALLVLVIAVALVAYCVWDFWGRFVAVRREAEKAKRS